MPAEPIAAALEAAIDRMESGLFGIPQPQPQPATALTLAHILAAAERAHAGPLGALAILESAYCADRTWVRRPRSKRRRIRKKWMRDPRNWRVVPWPDLLFHQAKGVLIGHPQTIAALRQQIPALPAPARGLKEE